MTQPVEPHTNIKVPNIKVPDMEEANIEEADIKVADSYRSYPSSKSSYGYRLWNSIKLIVY